MLEKGGPRYALPLCARRKDREREGTLTHKPGSVNGKCQSDRGQVIGGKPLIEQLAPYGLAIRGNFTSMRGTRHYF